MLHTVLFKAEENKGLPEDVEATAQADILHSLNELWSKSGQLVVLPCQLQAKDSSSLL